MREKEDKSKKRLSFSRTKKKLLDPKDLSNLVSKRNKKLKDNSLRDTPNKKSKN